MRIKPIILPLIVLILSSGGTSVLDAVLLDGDHRSDAPASRQVNVFENPIIDDKGRDSFKGFLKDLFGIYTDSAIGVSKNRSIGIGVTDSVEGILSGAENIFKGIFGNILRGQQAFLGGSKMFDRLFGGKNNFLSSAFRKVIDGSNGNVAHSKIFEFPLSSEGNLLLNSVGTFLSLKNSLLERILKADNGLFGSLLNKKNGQLEAGPGDVLQSERDLLGGVTAAVNRMVKLLALAIRGLLKSVEKLTQNLDDALKDVDVSDPEALKEAFSKFPINHVCAVCGTLANPVAAEGCKRFCTNGTCRWQF